MPGRVFLTPINLSQNELQNAVVQNLGSAPGSPVKGQLYFDSGGNVLYWYNGSGWVAAQGGAGAVPATTVSASAVGDASVVGVATTYAREDHKHSREAFAAVSSSTTFGQAANNGAATTVIRSDHVHGTPVHDDTAHSGIHLNALAQPTATVNFGGQLATNLATPVGNTDSATKLYVDSAIAGLSWHTACRAATTVTGTLATAFANGQTIDGVVLATNDRILIKDQATGTENGIYFVNAAGAPTRALDADTGPELLNAAVWVGEGTVNHDTQWVCNNVGAITVGSTTVTFVQYSGASVVTAGGGLIATGNVYAVGAGTGITVNADDVAVALNGVDNTRIADMPANTFKGNNTGSSADPQDVTVANMQTALSIPALPVTVANGGTGRNTGTTAYGLIAAGTTAAGIQQTVTPAASGFLKTTSATALPAFAAIAEADVTNLTTDLAAKAATATTVTAGNGLTGGGDLSASRTLDVGAGTGITVAADTVALDTTYADGRYARKTSANCAAATTTTVTHNFGTRDIVVEVYRNTTPWDTVDVDVERTDTNNVLVRFATAPSASAYRIVIAA